MRSSAPEPEENDNSQKPGLPSLDQILSLDDAPDLHERISEGSIVDRQQMIKDFRKKLRDSFDMEDDFVDGQMKPIRDSIKNILKTRLDKSDGSEESMRDQFISLMAKK